MFQKHILKISVAISILLHLLLFLSFKSLSMIQIFPSTTEELLEKQPEQESRLEFELVETPDDARSDVPPEHAELVSDKNSIARDRHQQGDQEVGNPYSEGDMDVKNLPFVSMETRPMMFSEQERAQREQQETQQNQESRESVETSAEHEYTFEKFSRQQLIRNSQAMAQAQPQEQLNRPLYDNRKFSAKDIGGFSFNTYNWNFAPYMLAMKKKVERNIFPPPAFIRMGLISGNTVLRFKVLPSGEVKDLEVLKYSGHESLKETSVQAILNSSPFKPLPADFPEDYLEVTASFSYYIRRR